MIRKAVLLSFLCCLVALSADARILPIGGNFVSGTVSSVEGTRVLLFDGRIALDAGSAAVRSEFGPASLADLEPGDRIAASVTPDPNGTDLVAVMIHILSSPDATLSGTVEAVDLAAQTIQVLGQTIRVTSSTTIRGLRGVPVENLANVLPGQQVRVDLDKAAPELTARTIVVVAPVREVHLFAVGVVEAIEANVWTIRTEDRTFSVTVTSETTIVGTPRVGDRVQINYRTDLAGQHFAVSIAPAPEAPQRQRVVHGTVLEITDTTLRISTRQGALIIVVDALTKFHGGKPQVGERVQVYLRNSPLTIFIADRVVRMSGTENRIVFVGTVFSIRENVWTIEGMQIKVTPTTRLINEPGLGDRVHVIATQNEQGTFALEIETVF